jgi:capsular polysaccharide transport system permease protein
VVFALILREMRTRFGRSRLGYLWAVLEPMGHLATLGTVFSFFNTSPPPVGNSLFLYYITGLLPFLIFSHLAHDLMHSRSGAGSVMQLPLVHTLDVLTARSILLFATEITVMIIILGLAAMLLGQGWPADPLNTAAAVLALATFAVGVGFFNCTVVEFWSSWETFFAALIRLMYFVSGIYYSPISMPAEVRDILIWNPVLQGIEWFRAGFYLGYEPHWLHRGYMLASAAVALLLGLAAERAARQRMRGIQ